MPRTNLNTEQRFFLYAEGSPDSEQCWEWAGTLGPGGYGRIWVREVRRHAQAHRFGYELLRGPCPGGLFPGSGVDQQPDHLCRNRTCVNPWHLDWVDRLENVQRGLKGRLRTQCEHGHPYTSETTRITREGFRVCRTCKNERERMYRARP